MTRRLVFAALQAIFRQQVDHFLGLAQGAHERHHDFDVGQAHVIAHAFHRFAFHVERFGEVGRQVARRAAETQHRVFFVRLVARTADQLLVLVRLEVGQAHDDLFRPERGGDRRDAFGQLVDVKRFRRGMAARHRFDRLFQVGVDVRVFEDRVRVHADIVVDDEFQARQADAGVRHRLEVEGQLRIADVEHDLGVEFAAVRRATLPTLPFPAGRRRSCLRRLPRTTTVTNVPSFSTSVASPQPTTAGTPSSRAMIAAWQVRPPRLVTIAEARFMTGSQFGSVMSATSTSPGCTRSMSAGSWITRTGPAPIFWPMARPWVSTVPVLFSLKRCCASVDFCCDLTVSGRACRMYSLPSRPSLPHSMSIGRP